jgi:hypothetical protein
VSLDCGNRYSFDVRFNKWLLPCPGLCHPFLSCLGQDLCFGVLTGR